MRILIYGGCHATAIKRIFDRYLLGRHDVSTLVNFQLIRSKIPFPYASLAGTDLVVFSPILNQGEWNTSHLEQACGNQGVKFLKFPWLQWGGYWPNARKRLWGPHGEWCVPRLHELATASPGFEDFYRALFEPSAFSSLLPGWLEKTTRKLIDNETAGATDIRISGYISDNFARHQLFLTPDHPSTELYKYLIRELSDRAGLEIDPGFYHLSTQVQEGVRTPVMPGVARALALQFCAGEWAHHDFLGDNTLSLRQHAMSYHPATPIMLAETTHATRAKVSSDPSGTVERLIPLHKRTHLPVAPMEGAAPAHHQRFRVLGGGGCPDTLVGSIVLLYKSHVKLHLPGYAERKSGTAT